MNVFVITEADGERVSNYVFKNKQDAFNWLDGNVDYELNESNFFDDHVFFVDKTVVFTVHECEVR